jgi:putative ABC transport system ATP-binding protein
LRGESPIMISIENLRFRYPEGEFALHVPALRVDEGERIAIIGPSGSGKTTLLNLIAGIRTAQSGSVTTLDTEMGTLDDAQRRDFRIRRIGLVFQEFELLEYLNVLDNVLLPFRVHRALELSREVRDRALALADEFGIGRYAKRYVDHLSQGERQRVSVCRALVVEPSLILADEPTGNLDPTNKDRVLDILLDYTSRHGSTLITVTHDHDLLPRFERVVDFKQFYDIDGGSEPSAVEREPVP